LLLGADRSVSASTLAAAVTIKNSGAVPTTTRLGARAYDARKKSRTAPALGQSGGGM